VSGLYAQYLTAMAESRALARVYRRKMNIKIAAIEEVNSEHIDRDEQPISDQQKMLIKKQCKDKGISTADAIKKANINKDLDELCHREVTAILQVLQD